MKNDIIISGFFSGHWSSVFSNNNAIDLDEQNREDFLIKPKNHKIFFSIKQEKKKEIKRLVDVSTWAFRHFLRYASLTFRSPGNLILTH